MKTVGIVGSQSRIGTTTQALQLVLCLQELEYDAAYVEMGSRDYLKKLNGLYENVHEESNGMVLCKEIPMFTSSHIVAANRKGYDFLIKDYGSICDSGFEKISFLEQDIKIIVGGIKANEIEFVEAAMEEACYSDVYYIFSFVSKEEQQDIKALMGDRKQYTYFSMYTPDPFTYKENEAYSYLLGEEG